MFNKWQKVQVFPENWLNSAKNKVKINAYQLKQKRILIVHITYIMVYLGIDNIVYKMVEKTIIKKK